MARWVRRTVAARIVAVKSMVIATCADVLLAGKTPATAAIMDANAAFPQRTLAVAKRRIARKPLATVVVGEDHEGRCREAMPLERSEDLSHAEIRTLEHANVIGARRWNAVIGSLVQSQVSRCASPWHVMVLGGRHVRRLKRPVDGVVGDLEKERCVRTTIHEVHRAPRDLVCEVAGTSTGVVFS